MKILTDEGIKFLTTLKNKIAVLRKKTNDSERESKGDPNDKAKEMVTAAHDLLAVFVEHNDTSYWKDSEENQLWFLTQIETLDFDHEKELYTPHVFNEATYQLALTVQEGLNQFKFKKHLTGAFFVTAALFARNLLKVAKETLDFRIRFYQLVCAHNHEDEIKYQEKERQLTKAKEALLANVIKKTGESKPNAAFLTIEKQKYEKIVAELIGMQAIFPYLSMRCQQTSNILPKHSSLPYQFSYITPEENRQSKIYQLLKNESDMNETLAKNGVPLVLDYSHNYFGRLQTADKLKLLRTKIKTVLDEFVKNTKVFKSGKSQKLFDKTAPDPVRELHHTIDKVWKEQENELSPSISVYCFRIHAALVEVRFTMIRQASDKACPVMSALSFIAVLEKAIEALLIITACEINEMNDSGIRHLLKRHDPKSQPKSKLELKSPEKGKTDEHTHVAVPSRRI